MNEQLVRVPTTGTEICYETLGSSSDPPILLIMGLGTQMIAWPDDFCRDLASRGNFVVRFDNRDVGRSTHFNDLATPPPLQVFLRRSRPPYRLEDMAADTVGLLDSLGIERAHVVGASMGGFIAQLVAIANPERLRSLSLIMTSTGSRRVGRPRPRVMAQIGRGRRRRPEADRESAMELVAQIALVIGSPGYPYDESYLRDMAGRGYDRAYDPSGYLRQVEAIMAQTDRTAGLRRISVPTVVIHGLADPLVAVTGGRAIARAIPRSRFVGLAGMGHDLPRALWPRIADEIVQEVGEGESELAARCKL